MSPDRTFRELLRCLDVSEAELAGEFGIPVEDIHGLLTGTVPVSRLHTLAIERFAMALVARTGNLNVLPFTVMLDALALTKLFNPIIDAGPGRPSSRGRRISKAKT